MEIKAIEYEFTICKVRDLANIDFDDEFFFIGRTDEENSLVCRTDRIPDNVVEREDGWRAFRIQDKLDFSLIGVLSRISSVLADHNIGIFVISTFNTDYILTKAEDFQNALKALEKAGYKIS